MVCIATIIFHRFQSEVPYLISSLLSQGFPEKVEKPRVQVRSLRPRPKDEPNSNLGGPKLS